MENYLNLPISDKVAVVFYGLVGGLYWRNGTGKQSNLLDCSKTFRYNVVGDNDCDIFVHSWSDDQADKILDAYRPIEHLIQKQEMFGYSGTKEELAEYAGNDFRSTSYWNSIKRGVSLKTAYEIKNGFRYKWVLVTRLDSVFFSKIDFTKLDQSMFYVISEPVHGSIPGTSRFWDPRCNLMEVGAFLYLSNSVLINEFSTVADEVANGEYKNILWVSEAVAYEKLNKMFNGDTDKIQCVLRRFHDFDIYRTVVTNFSSGREIDFARYCNSNNIDMQTNLRNLLQKIDSI